jgi:hypothetical protein
MMRPTPHATGRTRTVLRALLGWLLIGALVISSSFSVHAHAFQPGHGGTLQASQDIDVAPDQQPLGDVSDDGCHCACQHFSGTVVPFAFLNPTIAPAARIVARLPATITHPPAASHPPPIAWPHKRGRPTHTCRIAGNSRVSCVRVSGQMVRRRYWQWVRLSSRSP